jgi:hypothetical protein
MRSCARRFVNRSAQSSNEHSVSAAPTRSVFVYKKREAANPTAAIAAAALVGPTQVAARLVEYGALRTVHPLVSARLAAVLHPIGAAIPGLTGPGAITAFALLHGAGNGLLTIAKGTLPLAIFGPVGYGLRSGILGAPARATQAAAPLVFGLLIDRMGIGVLGEQTLDRQVTSFYASYLQRDPRFQDANLRALSGRTCPRADQAFLQRLIDYCIATGYLRQRSVQRTSG